MVVSQSLISFVFWDNCAYFARKDFYKSKILEILTLPRSLDYELIVKFHKSKDAEKFYRVTYATITLIIRRKTAKMISSYHCYFYSSLRSFKSKSSLRTLYLTYSFHSILISLCQFAVDVFQSPSAFCLASWYVRAYFVRKDFVVPLALEIQTCKIKKDYLAW